MAEKPQPSSSPPAPTPAPPPAPTPIPTPTLSPEKSHSAPINLESSVQYLKKVGPKRALRFQKLGIRTIRDLLRHWPVRYEIECAGRPIAQLAADHLISARGEIGAVRVVGRGRSSRFEATLMDETGRLHLTWFHGGFLVGKIHPGTILQVQGKTKRYSGYLQMVNPKWEIIPVDDEDANSPRPDHQLKDRLRPVYPATEDLSSELIDEIVQYALQSGILSQIRDYLQPDYRKKRKLTPLDQAVRMIHQPANESEVAHARRRFVFDEFLLLQLAIAMKRNERCREAQAPVIAWNTTIDKHIRARFPFQLTEAQNSVISEIRSDLTKPVPMNRLLQGDVGSGKTVVALYAMLMAVNSEQQAALMAPTEILAEQHFLSITAMLQHSQVKIALLTGRLPAAEKKQIYADLQNGEVDIIIGTHALLNKNINFRSLALVVIDEQHRFGVEQRAALRERTAQIANAAIPDEENMLFANETAKAIPPTKSQPPTTDEPPGQPAVHTLVMTATPIPRTMALTVFGDLDISTIDELPPGRTPVITKVVNENQRLTVYQYVAERLRKGEQAYVVLPAIDESPDSDLKFVKEHAEHLKTGPFHDLEIAEMHGRMKRTTRAKIMHRFRNNEIRVLVATTVIEVGVDVPNATIMIVEHADRFGLSQLHQLRGRVGRSSKKSLCILFADPRTEEAQQRLAAISETTDGFQIAEKDFDIRGMGEIFGTRQSGSSPFRIAQFPRDFNLLRLARKDARNWIEKDPGLSQPQNTLIRKRLMIEVGRHFGIGDVG